jgi:hypothetical protein
MDLTIPYTFYPLALPHWMAWTFFAVAMLCGCAVGVVRGVRRGWIRGIQAGVFGITGFLAATVLASMVVTFFLHDQ